MTKVDWFLLPPPPHLCQKCAVDHSPELPHDNQSLAYQYWFYSIHARFPTWVDAMAHCTPEMQEFWKNELRQKGVEIDDH